MLLFSPYLVLVMPLSVSTFPVVGAPRVHASRSLRRSSVNEKDLAKAPPVYWLTRLAGLGKTTIAYTICELLNEERLPFGSFFCESLQLDSSNSKRLVPTLCHELYMSYAGNVLSILGTNAMDVEASLAIQINELLAKPWQTSIAHRKDLPTPVVVVDALDESDRVSGRAASRCSY